MHAGRDPNAILVLKEREKIKIKIKRRPIQFGQFNSPQQIESQIIYCELTTVHFRASNGGI